MEIDYDRELKRLFQVIDQKIHLYHDAGDRRSTINKRLQLIIGVTALISGASITAIIALFIPDTVITKAICAMLSFLSATCSLVLGIYFDEAHTRKIFEGVARYRSLLIKAKRVLVEERNKKSAYLSLARDYQQSSAEFDRLLPARKIRQAETTGEFGFAPPELMSHLGRRDAE